MNTVNDLFELMPCSDLAGIQTMIVDGPDRAFANHGEVRITSCFQPVISLTHGRAVGFEALLRANDSEGNAVAPMALFDLGDELDEVLLLDRLSCTVHVHNFLKQPGAAGWLFVNMNPQVFVESARRHGFFAGLFAQYALPPGRMVVELLEESDTGHVILAEAMAAFRAEGGLVAFDDFNANSADLDRVWALRPDIVKINRRLTEWAVKDRKTRRDLANAVRALHEMNCHALLQGVETQEQAELALELQVDLAQGYYLGRPEFDIPPPAALRDTCAGLGARFRARTLGEVNRQRDRLAAYLSGVWSATVLLESDLGLAIAVQGIAALPATLSCYLVDGSGHQAGNRVYAPSPSGGSAAYAHLISSSGANYAHLPCFRNAWARPGYIQVSEPAFGIMAQVPCVTLSTTVQIGGALHVLCVETDAQLLGTA